MQAKKELQRLQEERQDGIRELGTIALDMYRRREIDTESLRGRARELASIDERIRDLEARLRLAAG